MAGLFYVTFSVALCIAIYRKLHTVLRRLTGHPRKWRSHFLGKPAPYKCVLPSAVCLVQNFVSIAILRNVAVGRALYLQVSETTLPLPLKTALHCLPSPSG